MLQAVVNDDVSDEAALRVLKVKVMSLQQELAETEEKTKTEQEQRQAFQKQSVLASSWCLLASKVHGKGRASRGVTCSERKKRTAA